MDSTAYLHEANQGQAKQGLQHDTTAKHTAHNEGKGARERQHGGSQIAKQPHDSKERAAVNEM
jgi:hypothetical protein